MTPRLNRAIALLALVSIMLAGCTGGDAPSSAASAESQPASTDTASPTDGPQGSPDVAGIGAPEETNLTVAIGHPNPLAYAIWFIAKEEGYLDESGLAIDVIIADDPRAAVVSGDADIGLVGAGQAIQAINQDLAVEVISGGGCRQRFAFAVQPDINDVSGLAGKDITLAGTPGDPAEAERARVLKEAGWDLDQVDVNLVYPGSGSEAWREFFLAGRIALMPYFSDDLVALTEYGANFPVTELKAWPNSVFIAREGWVQESPNAAAHFLQASMRSLAFIQAPGIGQLPENKERILELYRQYGWEDDADVVAQDNTPYAFSAESLCDNLYYAEEAWDTTVQNGQLDVTTTFEEGTDLSALFAAQESLGIDNSAAEDIELPDPAE